MNKIREFLELIMWILVFFILFGIGQDIRLLRVDINQMQPAICKGNK